MIGAKRVILLGGVPSWVLKGAKFDLDFSNGRYFNGSPSSLLSISRASFATDLLPSSASGASYNTFGNNILRLTPIKGLLIEDARTNQLLNSTTPATQTTASLGTASYTLWVNGSGSALASGGTATIAGAAPATNGSPNTFTVTVAGTVVVTVTGPLNAFQLETGAFGTSLIVTGGTIAARAADNVSIIGGAQTLIKATQASVLFIGGGSSQTVPTAARMVVGNSNMILCGNASNSIRNIANAVTLSATLGSGTTAGSIKAAVAWSAAGRSLVGNNGTLTTDANAQTNNINTLSLGYNPGDASAYDGYITRLALWSSRLPDATLKALTQ